MYYVFTLTVLKRLTVVTHTTQAPHASR